MIFLLFGVSVGGYIWTRVLQFLHSLSSLFLSCCSFFCCLYNKWCFLSPFATSPCKKLTPFYFFKKFPFGSSQFNVLYLCCNYFSMLRFWLSSLVFKFFYRWLYEQFFFNSVFHNYDKQRDIAKNSCVISQKKIWNNLGRSKMLIALKYASLFSQWSIDIAFIKWNLIDLSSVLSSNSVGKAK